MMRKVTAAKIEAMKAAGKGTRWTEYDDSDKTLVSLSTMRKYSDLFEVKTKSKIYEVDEDTWFVSGYYTVWRFRK